VGGRFLARGQPARVFEAGVYERTVIIECDSVEQAIAAYESPGYQAAVRALGVQQSGTYASSKQSRDAAPGEARVPTRRSDADEHPR
jgi:uncharacterized protein (DUF1330 family)